jgi:hypothetical protein
MVDEMSRLPEGEMQSVVVEATVVVGASVVVVAVEVVVVVKANTSQLSDWDVELTGGPATDSPKH